MPEGVTTITYRLDLEEVVHGIGPVGQRRHPAELPVEHVQDEGGVGHALLQPPQEAVVLLGEALRHGQGLIQLLLQRALQGVGPRAVCQGEGGKKWCHIHHHHLLILPLELGVMGRGPGFGKRLLTNVSTNEGRA